jgi:hypothetical protein
LVTSLLFHWYHASLVYSAYSYQTSNIGLVYTIKVWFAYPKVLCTFVRPFKFSLSLKILFRFLVPTIFLSTVLESAFQIIEYFLEPYLLSRTL